MDAAFDREPVKLPKDRSDVLCGGGLGDNAGSRILDQLRFKEATVWESRENRITTVETGCDQGVTKNGNAVRCERRRKTVTWLMCATKDGVLSRVTPRLLTRGEEKSVEMSVEREKL